ncbi:MAG: hypothetical protein ACWA5L_04745 [bacterium]
MSKSFWRISCLISGFIALSACANNAAKYADEPYYPAGFNDGCESAQAVSLSQFTQDITRDEDLFNNDNGYRYGWRQGYNSCGTTNLRNEDSGYEITDNPF